ncbi:hypothetical protein P175DRAFT_0436784 [Aspergillus ochraceoroseus IBT 24754]|uniref:Endo-chitosanase n=1 Tax=Aspergillus ochraceoroseus IBT 24754 TaxID=1392256 RepID=A0A2T5LY78_9EURO|nr:uncharacterized protein P175DRAFT_0436784 [Aspergillus ochraceoroseus IBT 24754]PTU21244.1 hypothetical protein P175DRAFT_0436784 [Aspergillus ochraceoroseus IBT 24754]
MAIGTRLQYLAVCTTLFGSALSQVVSGSDYNKPDAGPPASYFSATATMPVAALKSAAAECTKVPAHATYPISEGSSIKSTIYSDWSSFSKGAAIVFTADMDVDCDGLDYKCKGNPDGQSETDWGALAAYEVPWIVIPDKYVTANSKKLPGNNIAAVICNGKMFYGILGDTNGDDPEVTGEASWLMARTCFPDEDLNGDSGHTPADVTYIVFLGDSAVLPSSALNTHYITNFGTLKSMGDSLVNALASNLGLSGTKTTSATTLTTTTTASTSTASCSWEGHCKGASCSSDDDCSGDLVCTDSVCSVDEDCSWSGHCEGASCSSDDDCSGNLVCKDSVCSSS